MARRLPVLVLLALVGVSAATPVRAQSACERAVIFTLPAVTWHDVDTFEPPELMQAVDDGAVGSISVRTNTSRTTYASGFATLGGGTRLDATQSAAQTTRSAGGQVRLAGIGVIDELAEKAGYTTAVPGALARALAENGRKLVGAGDSTLGYPPQSPRGTSVYAATAVTDPEGRARLVPGDAVVSDASAPFGVRTDPGVVAAGVGRALSRCAVVVVDPGDLVRADALAVLNGEDVPAERRAALETADRLLGAVRDELDPGRDLLIVVSPASPLWDQDTHFGVAVAVGPGFEAGSFLSSPSTRRAGLVALPEVAPTVLDFLEVERPASMLGRPWFTVGASQDDRIGPARDLDRESVFVDSVRPGITTAFVLAQVALYALTVWMLWRRENDLDDGGRRRHRQLELAALALAAFPLATYLAGVVQGYRIGVLLYSLLLIAIDGVIVFVARLVARTPLVRLLVIVAATLGLLLLDLLIGAPLQLNTVFSYSPLVAGRFAGIGNIGFAVLAATSLLTGTLLIHRFGRSQGVLAAVAAIFAVTVLIDGAPRFGSDVGGALALVPGLGVSWMLLSGRRVSWRTVVVAGVATLAVLALFLAWDLARASDERTHLGRLFEDVTSGGGQVFLDTLERKIRTNLRVARSTIWTFVVPPALGVLAWLLFFPKGRWERLRGSHPTIAAGLVAGAVLAVLGYLVNDSGIVIPATMCAYLVPVGLLAHMAMDPAAGR